MFLNMTVCFPAGELKRKRADGDAAKPGRGKRGKPDVTLSQPSVLGTLEAMLREASEVCE